MELVVVDGVTVLWGGECAAFNLLPEIGQGSGNYLGQVDIHFEETRGHFLVQPQHILGNQGLAIAMDAGANTNCGNIQTSGDNFGQPDGQTFQNQGKRPAVCHFHRVDNHHSGRVSVAPGQSKKPRLHNLLLGNANVAHYRNSVGGDGPYQHTRLARPFQMHAVGLALFH